MSKIFEALRMAQQAQATAELDRRRSRRMPLRVPVFVYGHLSCKMPFHERAYLQQVSADGGLLTLSTDVKHGQKLLLINDFTHKERKCFVVHSRYQGSQRIEVGIEFAQPCPDFVQNNSNSK